MNYPLFWNTCTVVAAFVAAGLVNTAQAQDVPLPSQEMCWEPSDTIDEANSYCGISAMPDHIRFFLAVGMLNAEWDDPEAGVRYVSSNAGFNEQAAQAFIDKMQPLITDMNNANREALKEAACVPDLNEWTATRAMNALNQLDDINEAVWQRYFVMAKIVLTESEVFALQELMSSYSAAYVRSDFSEVYKGTPERAKQKLLQICEN